MQTKHTNANLSIVRGYESELPNYELLHTNLCKVGGLQERSINWSRRKKLKADTMIASNKLDGLAQSAVYCICQMCARLFERLLFSVGLKCYLMLLIGSSIITHLNE